MTLLNDREIYNLISSNQIIGQGFAEQDRHYWKGKNSAIQASSLDLHVGQIFIPGKEDKPLCGHCLKPGQTVIVKTRESLDLPGNISAIGFPPSNMSSRGILTTNPGHVDPGYKGLFHITLINMGKKPFPLTTTDRIVTLLLFKLDNKAEKDHSERNATNTLGIEINTTNDMLSYLATDFMDFKSRSKEIAEEIAEEKVSRSNIRIQSATTKVNYITASAVILVTIISSLFGFLERKNNTKIDSLEKINAASRLDVLEKNYDSYKTKDEIVEIKKQLEDLENKMRTTLLSNSNPQGDKQ